MAGGLRGFLDRSVAAENDQIGERDLLAAGLRRVELILDCFELLQRRLQLSRLVDLPVLLRREANTRAVRSTTLVGATERRRRRPGGRNELGDGQARREDFCLQTSNLLLSDQRMIDHGDRVLPDQYFLRDERPEITMDRPHVAVRELEPGPRKCVRE